MTIDTKLNPTPKQRDKSAIWGCFVYHTFQQIGVDKNGSEVKYCTLYSGLNQHHTLDCGYAGEPIDIQIGEWRTLIPYRQCNYIKASALALMGDD